MTPSFPTPRPFDRWTQDVVTTEDSPSIAATWSNNVPEDEGGHSSWIEPPTAHSLTHQASLAQHLTSYQYPHPRDCNNQLYRVISAHKSSDEPPDPTLPPPVPAPTPPPSAALLSSTASLPLALSTSLPSSTLATTMMPPLRETMTIGDLPP